MSSVIHLADSNFTSEVLEADRPVLVYFWASWCGPCKMMGPLIDDLSKEYKDKVKICKLDVDKYSQTAGDYAIMSIPTIIIFKNGEESNRLVGFVTKAKIAKTIDISL